MRYGSPTAFWALVLLVMWLPIPYGSNTDWAIALLGVSTFFILAMWALMYALGGVRLPSTLWMNRWIILLWLLWLGWIMFQLLPMQHLPFRSLHSLATETGMISIKPDNTYRQLLLSATYFGLYLLVILLAGHRDRLRVLGMAIVISGLIQAAYGSLMVLSGLEWGYLGKKTVQLGYATGTFINKNHLAGYLEICTAMAIGLVVADMRAFSSGSWRVWLRDLAELAFSRKLQIRIFVAIMVVALVMTRSRMGNTALFASLLLCGSLYVFLRERRLFAQAVVLFASFLVVDLLIVSEWFGLERLASRIESTDIESETRIYILPELIRGIDAYWPLGSGLGSFEIAILPFRNFAPMKFYDHAHNDYAEFLIEVGMPGALILAAMALATAVHAIRVIQGRRNRLRVGVALAALLALVSIAIHGAADFNLRIPANAASLVVVMAMVNACSHRSKTRVRITEQQDANGPLAGASS